MDSVSVIIGTFGDYPTWKAHVVKAMESVSSQTVLPDEVIWIHGTTLAEARNEGANRAFGSRLIFLDADDTLDPRYIESMLGGSGDIRYPSTLGVQDGVDDDYPVLLQARDLREANYIVIGAMVDAALFKVVGGFDQWACLEDWALWLECWLRGADVQACPEAIYRVTVRADSRNQNQTVHHKAYNEIRRKYRGWPRSPISAWQSDSGAMEAHGQAS